MNFSLKILLFFSIIISLLNFINSKIESTTIEEQCQTKIGLDLSWKTEIEGGIYSTPLLVDLDGDGQKEIIVQSIFQFVAVLNSQDGKELPGWPLIFPDMIFHTRPVYFNNPITKEKNLIFTSFDGDIIVSDKNGNVLSDFTLKVPPLLVHKKWYSISEENIPLIISVRQSNPKLNLLCDHENDEQKENLDDFTFYNQSAKEERHIEKSSLILDILNKKMNPQKELTEEAKQAISSLLYLNAFTLAEELTFTVTSGYLKILEKQLNNLNPKYKNEYLYVNPHILSAPVVTPDNLLIIGVSYFFDNWTQISLKYNEYFDSDIDLDEYVACGIAVFNLSDYGNLLWTAHLELSTENAQDRAYCFTSPTVVDLDGDGELDIILGTGLGMIYAFNLQGKEKEGFPITMSEIQSQVIVEDVNMDGKLEIVATDTKSRVNCFSTKGEKIWGIKIEGFSSQTPTMGDVDGDGKPEIIIATENGMIWAIKGSNGKIVDGFPIKIPKRVLSPILPIRLKKNQENVQLVFVSFDGIFRVIDPVQKCEESIDLGEISYSMILSDDFLLAKTVQLLVTTTSGSVMCFSTNASWFSLRSWSSQIQDLNGISNRENFHGVYFLDFQRYSYNWGSHLPVNFVIVDQFLLFGDYVISLFVGDDLAFEKSFSDPGNYQVVIKTPILTESVEIRIVMKNRYSQYFSDSFVLLPNEYVFRLIHWFMIIPFLVAGLIILCSSNKNPLPI
ncbi:protein defective in exine formation 1 [Anaeramoeba ignava]|uniref:Protein defective in exine formation 1 n=1 Tax=Anaeramoeba ignava TaxID=1746090 RepID=A0A9Q0LMM7_ANAIG|nr:protein defective in exine formation 1 [Anaeramoeba ignava]